MTIDWTKHARAVIERLGEDVDFTPSGGVTLEGVKMIYVEPYYESPMGDGVIASSAPMATGMSADLANIAEDDELEIRGTTYIVKDPRPDAMRGTVTVTLSKG